MQRAVLTVRGRVQKVGYRDLVAEMANKMDITGMVENLPDGKSVKIIAEAEKDVLNDFIKSLWVKDDPTIKVKNIDAVFEPATGEYEFFDIMYEDFQKEGFERIGEAVMFLKRIDTKQDTVIKKLDYARTEIVGEIREMRGELRSYLDNRFIKIEYDIAEIKAKIGLS